MIYFTESSDGCFEVDKDSLNTTKTPNSVIEKMLASKEIEFSKKADMRGANCKFWILNDTVPEGLLFKYSKQRNEDSEFLASFYGELIVDMIAYHTYLNHTSYYPCKFLMRNGSVLEGTLSPSYKQHGYNQEFSAENITKRYIQSQYDNNNGVVEQINYNTVYEYIKELRYLYPYRIDETKAELLKLELLKWALLDFATLQIDRHWGNLGWMTINSEGMSSIVAIPGFDSECCCTLDRTMEKVDAFAHNLISARDSHSRYVKPMATSKSNAPLLGIKTSLVEVKNDRLMVNRKFGKGEPSNYDIFIPELASEILQNEKLEEFYESLKSLNIEILMRQSKCFPESVIVVASTLINERLDMLEKELNKQRSENNESILNV